jgi:hypothetical protein
LVTPDDIEEVVGGDRLVLRCYRCVGEPIRATLGLCIAGSNEQFVRPAIELEWVS